MVGNWSEGIWGWRCGWELGMCLEHVRVGSGYLVWSLPVWMKQSTGLWLHTHN